MDKQSITKKNFLWNFIGSTLNGFNSLFFMIIITRVNGVDDAGRYTLLFSLACLFYMIGGYAGRTYQVSDKTKINSDDDYIGQRYITCSLMLIVALIYCMIMHYDVTNILLLLILTLLKSFEAYSDILYGIMQKREQLYLTGISATIKTIISILVFLVVDLLTHNIIVGFCAVICVWIAILFICDLPWSKASVKPHFNIQKINVLFKRGFYSFAFLFLSVYLANVTKYALDGRVESSSQAMYGIVLMPATLISLCCLYILQPSINHLSNQYVEKNYHQFRTSVRKIFSLIGGLAILALAAATVIGIPVLNLVYGVDLSDYKLCLQLIVVGASMNAAITLLSTALTIMYKTKFQFYIYVFVSVFAFFISGLLVNVCGVLGSAISYFVIMCVQLGLFMLYYEFECRKGNVR